MPLPGPIFQDAIIARDLSCIQQLLNIGSPYQEMLSPFFCHSQLLLNYTTHLPEFVISQIDTPPHVCFSFSFSTGNLERQIIIGSVWQKNTIPEREHAIPMFEIYLIMILIHAG